MLHAHLKKSLLLNRLIVMSGLFYGLLFTGMVFPQMHLHPLASSGLLLLSVAFLVINEWLHRLVSRLTDHDHALVETWSILAPMGLLAYTAVFYAAMGGYSASWPLFGLCLFPMLQAQLFGHGILARLLFGAAMAVFGVSILFGYLQQPAATSDGFHLFNLLMAAPFFLITYQFGVIVKSLVKATSNQVFRLQSLAATDGLTGLVNRRQFNQQLQAEVSRALRHKAPLSLALFDIDDFKKLNDHYGHPVGDQILRELGALISENVRESDIPARYGGEEFALILPETRQVEGYEILERLRFLVEQTVFCLPNNPITLTISIGLAQLDVKHKQTAFSLVERADAALYEAKRHGKNRVVYGPVPTPKLSMPVSKPHKPVTPR